MKINPKDMHINYNIKFTGRHLIPNIIAFYFLIKNYRICMYLFFKIINNITYLVYSSAMRTMLLYHLYKRISRNITKSNKKKDS